MRRGASECTGASGPCRRCDWCWRCLFASSRFCAGFGGSQRPPRRRPAGVETVTFDEAIARALEKNPSVAIASTNILRSEALLQQVRAQTMPRVGANVDQHHARQRALVRRPDGAAAEPDACSGSTPTLPIAPAQWAAKAQALDQVEIARLSVTDTRRQIAVATASAYLAVIAQKRQVEVSLSAIETARGQLDYNTRRREGGVGSRLNELRSAQLLSIERSAARSACGSTCGARRRRSACCSRPTGRSTSAASRRSRFRKRPPRPNGCRTGRTSSC